MFCLIVEAPELARDAGSRRDAEAAWELQRQSSASELHHTFVHISSLSIRLHVQLLYITSSDGILYFAASRTPWIN
jgi:hypothetical protein